MSNEIKCPVCGGNMRIAYYAENMECKNCGLEIPSIVIKGFQSRIDTAVKEAVGKEKAWWIKYINGCIAEIDNTTNDLYDHEAIAYGAGQKSALEKIKKELEGR